MDRYAFNIGKNPYEVKIVSIKKHQALVEVNGVSYDVDISNMDDFAQLAPQVSAQKPQVSKTPSASAKVSAGAGKPSSARPAIAASAGDIAAPMPGQILKVLVSEGDSIKAGDLLVTMEAMKMENQIKSTSNGTVARVHVKQGDTVAEGAPLVSLGK